jgi:hypothetical protein
MDRLTDRLDEIITSPSFDYLEQEDYGISGCEAV